MKKGEITGWAAVTLGLGWLLFRWAIPVFNELKGAGQIGPAYRILLVPLLAQAIFVAAGAVYSSRRKRREVVTGILFGLGLEVTSLAVLIIFSASAHY